MSRMATAAPDLPAESGEAADPMDAALVQAELIELDIHKCYGCRNRVTSQVLNLIQLLKEARGHGA